MSYLIGSRCVQSLPPPNLPPRTPQVVLSIVNFSKTRSLYRHGMSPVVRSALRSVGLNPAHMYGSGAPAHVVMCGSAQAANVCS